MPSIILLPVSTVRFLWIAALSNRTGTTGTMLANSIRGSRLWLGPWPQTDRQLYCHKTFYFHGPSMQHVILYVFSDSVKNKQNMIRWIKLKFHLRQVIISKVSVRWLVPVSAHLFAFLCRVALNWGVSSFMRVTLTKSVKNRGNTWCDDTLSPRRNVAGVWKVA